MKAIVTTQKAAGDTIHRFEAAGLGKAPFAFVGVQTAADRAGEAAERDTTGCLDVRSMNWATSCDYCGQGIKNAFMVRSADGRTFKVGCDCIRKTGDAGLCKVISQIESDKRRAVAEARRKARWEADRAYVAKARQAFETSDVQAKLSGQPHPVAHHAANGLTMLDYVQWLLANRYDTKAAGIILA